tara:strand:+ start:1198 stop:1803 length:606 start_codon:yes stop_codon:yes gene_type:complete
MSYTVTTSNDLDRNTLRTAYETNGMYENGSWPFGDVDSSLDTATKRREYYLAIFKGDSKHVTDGSFNADGTPVNGDTNTTAAGKGRIYLTITEDPSTVVEYVSGSISDGTFKADLSIHLDNAAGNKSYLYDSNYWDAVASCLVGLGCTHYAVAVWHDDTFNFLDKIKAAIGTSSRYTHVSDTQVHVYSAASIDTEVKFSVS